MNALLGVHIVDLFRARVKVQKTFCGESMDIFWYNTWANLQGRGDKEKNFVLSNIYLHGSSLYNLFYTKFWLH